MYVIYFRYTGYPQRGTWGPRGGGYSDTFIYTYIQARTILGGSKFQEFEDFRKMNIFGGMKKIWILFWGHYKIGLFVGGGGNFYTF